MFCMCGWAVKAAAISAVFTSNLFMIWHYFYLPCIGVGENVFLVMNSALNRAFFGVQVCNKELMGLVVNYLSVR